MADRRETEKERLDRNLNELLGGLRVVMPGVQVLFAFLLVVPFSERFGELTGFERATYFVTLIGTALSMTFLVAPATMHRIEFRADDKRHIVFSANRLAIIGFLLLALAITAAVLLVTHFVYDDALAVVTTAAVGGLLLILWYAMPYARRREVSRANARGLG